MTPQEANEKRIEIEKNIEKSREDLKAVQHQCQHEEFIFQNTSGVGYYFCTACKRAIAAQDFLARELVVGVFS